MSTDTIIVSSLRCIYKFLSFIIQLYIVCHTIINLSCNVIFYFDMRTSFLYLCIEVNILAGLKEHVQTQYIRWYESYTIVKNFILNVTIILLLEIEYRWPFMAFQDTKTWYFVLSFVQVPTSSSACVRPTSTELCLSISRGLAWRTTCSASRVRPWVMSHRGDSGRNQHGSNSNNAGSEMASWRGRHAGSSSANTGSARNPIG